MEKHRCGSCEHCDQGGGSGWVRYCEVIKDYVNITTTISCSRYESIWRENLFGETRYRELINAGLIKDATAYLDSEDLRPIMVKHRNAQAKRINELHKPNKPIIK